MTPGSQPITVNKILNKNLPDRPKRSSTASGGKKIARIISKIPIVRYLKFDLGTP